ncbi:MAG TPA: glycosyltransferase family 4 protein, partial [Candidatus Nitrosotenuis sp.]|nr:glycosyltransferase family 4 protein [Candidatus Nitrosotenuis sp.]
GSTDLFHNYLPSLYDMNMVRHMLEEAKKGTYDCVIFNHFESVLPLAPLYPTVPIVYIVHDYIDEIRRQMIEIHTSPNQHFISISDSQRRDAPDLQYASTVYNGIDASHFEYDPNAEDYLMFSGRITPYKGVREAVQVAMHANRRLLIAGSVSKNDFWYFDEHVKPFLNDRILFLGMLDKEQLVKYYKKASALLMPIQWSEPFGLSMIEANACGTPVIAFSRGSVPEIVEDGKTGFIVDNSAEMIMAVEKIKQIKRKNCRDHVEKKFTQEIMFKNYEIVLSNIVELSKSKKKAPTRLKVNEKIIRERIRKLSQKMTPIKIPKK